MEFSLPLWADVPVLKFVNDTHIFLVFTGIPHVAVCVHRPSAFQCVYCSQKCGDTFFMIPLGHLRYQITTSQAFPSQGWTNPALSLSLYVLCTSSPIVIILSLLCSSRPRTGGQKTLHVQALLCWREKYIPEPTDCPCSCSMVCGSASLTQVCASLACDTWSFPSSSPAGQAVFGAGWHWHWWHNWPWGVP